MKTNPSMSLDSTGYYSDSNYCEICSSPDKLTSDCPLVNLTRGFDGKRDFELSRVYGVAVESICMRICPLSQPVQNFELRVSTNSTLYIFRLYHGYQYYVYFGVHASLYYPFLVSITPRLVCTLSSMYTCLCIRICCIIDEGLFKWGHIVCLQRDTATIHHR